MKLPHRFKNFAALALAALLLIATPAAKGQTVISNETLVATTFVVNKKPAAARCYTTHCKTETSMFAPFQVICPAATGRTCTFHISVDTKSSVGYPPGYGGAGPGPTGFYQFLVDGTAPTIGPTDREGIYLFERNVYEDGLDRLIQPASVLATVKNASSNSHKIAVNVGCMDIHDVGTCDAASYSTTMRVDVFEP
jgi:hypothetical protein